MNKKQMIERFSLLDDKVAEMMAGNREERDQLKEIKEIIDELPGEIEEFDDDDEEEKESDVE